MRELVVVVTTVGLVYGCGGPSKPAATTDGAEPAHPTLAIEYLGTACAGGDVESCEVLDAMNAASGLCESGDQKGCQGLEEILEALRGLDAALAEERCMDPCSEECIGVCAKVADDETGPCIDTCMSECLAGGCD